ncbi:tellurite resistance TerB family protein [Nonlabens xiamenensis]|uniref:tellurite resistance TerB family protein n=1 Tax=Nonlabens xiamenensis TaxID=2341043 RepID=UPI000F6071E1|nr:TerB family tellurite resistance protein [Nonlabens xiamenensis]
MTYTTEERKQILGALIQMALADGQLQKEEIAFITSVAKRMEIGGQEVQHMLKNPENLKTVVPQDYTKRIVHFHRMMLMMHIDGHVDDQELQLLHEVGLQFGFRKTTIDALLKTMSKYPHGDIPPSELMQIHVSNQN